MHVNIAMLGPMLLPRAHAQGGKVIGRVVVSRKIDISQGLGT